MTTSTQIDPVSLIKPRRKISGISAILLPFTEAGDVDWHGWSAHVMRTVEAGLTPAVNMDTGYINLLDDATRLQVLSRTNELLGGEPFVAGAFVADEPGESFNFDGYAARIEEIQSQGGTPVIFQSYGLVEQSPAGIVASYQSLAEVCDRFIGFELTTDLAPFGAVYDLETYGEIIQIPQCIGAKHSSFHREPEWERLQLRDRVRPDFTVYTGNDFAIDMVMYGSDYLLGLSTFAPDLFAQRDHYWESGDPRFYELNDQLQYLGMFAFRTPGPAYKHSAAQFLKLRGWIDCDDTHPQNPKRPESDVLVLRELAERMHVLPAD
ncbi:MAG: dihydrodipicolinate synthase family protein [Planctomycetaceae bacterium]